MNNNGEKPKLVTTDRAWVRPVELPKRPQMEVKIRPVEQADVSFIFNSWLKSFRAGRLSMKVDNAIYFAEHHKVIERLLANATTLIACKPDEPGQIYGYIVFEKIDGIFVMHYVYTKHTYRQLGVARELLNHVDHDFKTAGCCSHLTQAGEKLHAKYSLIYHPYTLINYNREVKSE